MVVPSEDEFWAVGNREFRVAQELAVQVISRQVSVMIFGPRYMIAEGSCQ